MTITLEQQAEVLAQQSYRFNLEKDETVFIARVAEMPTCMAQGITVAEAEKELREVMFEFIFSLLEDGQEVPKPYLGRSASVGFGITFESVVYV